MGGSRERDWWRRGAWQAEEKHRGTVVQLRHEGTERMAHYAHLTRDVSTKLRVK